ncbi:MAG TPA: tail fiber domain-containing protein [Polyangia bacterium]
MRIALELLVVLLLCSAAPRARAAAPTFMPLQGLLTDASGAPVTGPVSVQFAVFDAQTGGTQVWTETQSVTTQAGVFLVYLGHVTPLNLAAFRDHGAVWLEIKVESNSPMPRVSLGSVAYAAYAEYCGPHVHQAADLPAGTVVGAQTCPADQRVRAIDGAGQLACGPVGRVTDVLTRPSGGLTVASSAGPQPELGLMSCPDGNVLRSTGAGTWDCASVASGGLGSISSVTAGAGLSGGGLSGDVTLTIAALGVVTAMLADGAVTDAKITSLSWSKITGLPGSTGFLARFAPSGLGAAAVFEDGTGNLGVGTTTPAAALDVQTGGARFSGFVQAQGSAADVTALGEGAHLQWNRDGVTGQTALLNQRGAYTGGGFVLGEISGGAVTESFRIESNLDRAQEYQRTPNLIGGFHENAVTRGATGAVIGGGGYRSGATHLPNTATDVSATVAGGAGNLAGNDDADALNAGFATVGGGLGNAARGLQSTVGGGANNTASGPSAVVAGGVGNAAAGHHATVGGGRGNTASGAGATVAGGVSNLAQGDRSLAAGSRARANRQGCFVWGDATDADVACDDDNRFVARASGGVYLYTSPGLTTGAYLAAGSGSWSARSDRDLKSDHAPVSSRDVLERVAALPITTWRYRSEASGARHMGPVAQDFHRAFGLGDSDRHIAAVDADGVALAAVQGLNQKLATDNAALRAELDDLRTRMTTMERQVKPLVSGGAGLGLGGLGLGGLLAGGLVVARRRRTARR